MAHHSAGDEQAIVLFSGVEIRAADTAALYRDNDLARAGSGIIDRLNAEGCTRLVKYGCPHVVISFYALAD